MDIALASPHVEQPPLYRGAVRELTVAIASLSLGGAEKIVLDWANRIYPSWRVHLIVLRDRTEEWSVPPFVRVTRVGGKYSPADLRKIGEGIAQSGNPVCVCHLLSQKERTALSSGGAVVVPVLHNAREGWPESSDSLQGAPHTIVVSEACERDLQEDGWREPVTVIRHIPSVRDYAPDARVCYRTAWRLPQNAFVIGMIGAVKPQKNYHFALKVFKTLLEREDAYLAIIGGPVNTSQGYPLWYEVYEEAKRLGVLHRLAMPGFVHDAGRCLPAFDVMLNTSLYEGMSIATLEALQSKTPIVASRVGGQGEVHSDGLYLIDPKSEPEVWVDAIQKSRVQKLVEPTWSHFPSYRLWTLAGLARPFTPSEKMLFVTANLNSGGAQRSLVNLAMSIKGRVSFDIMIAGRSTSTYFSGVLKDAGITVESAAEEWNSFSFTETLIEKITNERIGTVCFWNVDPRVKLLLAKMLSFSKVRFIDVSPGNFLFEEMDSEGEFQKFIAYTHTDFYKRLDTFVLKYNGTNPKECDGKTVVIPNGVPKVRHIKKDYRLHGAPRVVVSGRIAPSKFVVEIIEAMKEVRKVLSDAELHIFGAVEHLNAGYKDEVAAAVGDESARVIFHGANFQAVERLHEFDAFVVLGKHQGCPNALLEALAVGMPVIANDDGGTREQLIHEKTGLMVESCSPHELAGALIRILSDRVLAEKLGQRGRAHAESAFSMDLMASRYLELFGVEAEVEKESFAARGIRLVNSIREKIRSRSSREIGKKIELTQ